jgi:hypothetical protein
MTDAFQDMAVEVDVASTPLAAREALEEAGPGRLSAARLAK